ncbi:MAG: DUF333 domain-containing protein [Patescibacteria group bacterium]
MKKFVKISILLIALLFIAVFIYLFINKEVHNKPTQIANPAAVYCVEHHGLLEYVTNEDGSQTGYCSIPHGVTCEEWAFFRQECGLLESKESHEDCGSLTVKEAIEIASQSECTAEGILTDRYACDNDGDLWIGIDIEDELIGEMSGCNPACVVLTEDKKAKVSWRCSGLWGEGIESTLHLPKLESLISTAYAQNLNTSPIEEILSGYHDILSSIKKTSYAHHKEVTEGMDEDTGNYSTDCSGLAGYVVHKALSSEHYQQIDNDRQHHDNADRPLASDFYRFFKKQSTTVESNNQCWIKVEKLAEAQPGDIIVSKYNHGKQCLSEGSTGHVMFIDSDPLKYTVEGTDQYWVYVIDSANDGHADDTRDSGDYKSYDCKHEDKPCGIGRGKIWFGVNENDEPIYYRWDSSKTEKGKYCICGDEDCNDDNKNSLEGIIIGRPVICNSITDAEPKNSPPINNVIE